MNTEPYSISDVITTDCNHPAYPSYSSDQGLSGNINGRHIQLGLNRIYCKGNGSGLSDSCLY